MKIIIVDDEMNARLLLKSMINEYFEGIQILDEADNIPDTVKKIHEHKPDLVFLDIEMPSYTGLEILDFFDKSSISFEIVFVTAYSEFGLEAFDLDAVDYLLKPIRKEKLQRAIERVRKKIEAKKMNENDLLQNPLILDKIALQTNQGINFIEPSEIIYLKAEGAYTQFFLVDKKITVSKTLNHYIKLEEKGFFMRVHRSYIININHIQRVYKFDRTIVIMSDQKEIPISQDKKDALFKIIDQFKI